MIVNEREYRATQREIERFEEALAQIEATGGQRDPLEQRVLAEALRGDVEELRRRVQSFEQLRSGDVRRLDVASLEDLAELIVGARSALGLTQKELAERVGIKPQQVQRYEATRYAGVSIERLQAVAEAMELELRCELILPARQRRTGAQRRDGDGVGAADGPHREPAHDDGLQHDRVAAGGPATATAVNGGAVSRPAR